MALKIALLLGILNQVFEIPDVEDELALLFDNPNNSQYLVLLEDI